MRAWRAWGRSDQNENDRPEMPCQKEVDAAFDVCIEMLSETSLPSNLDEAAEEYASKSWIHGSIWHEAVENTFKAGAELMAEQGVTVKGLLYGGNLCITDIPEEFYTDKEEEVIVQIRKK